MYYIFISVIVCSVSMVLRLTVFLTLKQKGQVFKAYTMSVLLHLVTKHGIYNLISHKRRAVIIPACQQGAQNQLQSSSLLLLGHSLQCRPELLMIWEEQIDANDLKLSQVHQVVHMQHACLKERRWAGIVINRLFRFLELLSSGEIAGVDIF